MGLRLIRDAPGIGPALKRSTPAFESAGRPAPRSLSGQLWAALTRSTPAFAGAVPAEGKRLSGATSGTRTSHSPGTLQVNALEGAMASYVIHGNVHAGSVPSADVGVSVTGEAVVALTQ